MVTSIIYYKHLDGRRIRRGKEKSAVDLKKNRDITAVETVEVTAGRRIVFEKPWRSLLKVNTAFVRGVPNVVVRFVSVLSATRHCLLTCACFTRWSKFRVVMVLTRTDGFLWFRDRFVLTFKVFVATPI